MANPVQLQRIAKDRFAKEGQTVTVTWPAKSGFGTATTTAPAQPLTITVKALIYNKDIRLEGGGYMREVRGLFPVTSRALSGGTVTTLAGLKYTIKNVVQTAPNDVVVIQEVTLT